MFGALDSVYYVMASNAVLENFPSSTGPERGVGEADSRPIGSGRLGQLA